ncbi:nucleotidyltransferase domain-containing protein [Paenibacillus sp. alder61]|uniref:nucleotidyltransferase domain-containing protein n=1 Tax=Paenibacillus sp. alder61 TaxID=2862948 RepID=UPI001CD7530E|nr:nucleotidyltransferase domain-containing protein [Paenibacillus sp. alder61]MCA1292127.1 nucleotidyltransferase domain-containing protein [Paenibacillus sp. alder61]
MTQEPSEFRPVILNELRRIEEQEGVRILYACESGSRAWGFPSRDSDYDVRFLYIRPLDWYLSIFEGRDVIERPISDQLDINGWDLKKALRLFRKSNPPLLEWLHSPIQYLEPYSVAEQIRRISPLTFSPKSCIYHYLNMAKGNFRGYLQGERVKIKKYFYVLRPVLACGWIEKHNTMPPVEFDKLVEDLIPPESALMDAVQRLLARKKAGEELDLEPKLTAIHEYLEERLNYFEEAAAQFRTEPSQLEDERLDVLFRSALREVWA